MADRAPHQLRVLAAGVVHGIGTTPADVRLSWVLAVNIACLLAVAAAVAWRFTRPDGYPRRVS